MKRNSRPMPRLAIAWTVAVLSLAASSLLWRSADAAAADNVITGWLAGLADRKSTLPPGCTADSRPARPPIADYPVCTDQIRLFADALDGAQRSKRLLLVEFGATWCPSCSGLKKALRDPELLGADLQSGTLSRDVAFVPIGLSTVAGGRMTDVDSGQAILTRLLAAAPEVRFRAYPMIALLDPRDTSRIVIRNLDDLVLDGARVPVAGLTQVIAASRDHLLSGGAAPAEPSWLMRKLTRVLQKIW